MITEIISTIGILIGNATGSIPQPDTTPEYSKEAVLEYLEEKGEPVATWDRLIFLESTWNPNAKNPISEMRGLYQISPNTGNWLCSDLDYWGHWKEQTDCAIRIRNVQGWQAWSVMN